MEKSGSECKDCGNDIRRTFWPVDRRGEQEVRGTERIQRIQFWHGSRSQGSWPTATNTRGTRTRGQQVSGKRRVTTAFAPPDLRQWKWAPPGSAIVLFSPVNNAVDRIIAFRFSIRLRSSFSPLFLHHCVHLLLFFLSSPPLYFYRGIDSLYIGQQLRHRKSSRSTSTTFDVHDGNDYVDQYNWMVLNGIRFDGIKRFLLNAIRGREEGKNSIQTGQC